MDVQKLDLWWNVVIGTAVAVAIAIGFVTVLIYHTRTKLRIQREKMEAIDQSRREYVELFDSVSDCVYAHDLNGKILTINRSGERILGLPAASVVGHSLLELFPRGRARVEAYLRELGASRGECIGIVPLWSHSAGGMKIFEYRSSVIGREGVRGIARDITDRVRYEHWLEKSRRRINALLEREQLMQAKLARFSQETLRMQEEQRMWVSRELHDEVGQYLASILFNLEALKSGLAAADNGHLQRIEDTKKVASGVLDRVRSFLRQLRPPSIREIGLGGALQAMIAEFESSTGLPVAFTRDPLLEGLDDEQKVNLYRVIQESLSNIAKHANASAASIRIKETAGQLVIEVSDDGVGFDAGSQHTRHGLGLIGMRERLALARGEMHIVSAAGQGTTVRISFGRP